MSPLDRPCLVALLAIWQRSITTKSDFAREYADSLACLSSLGLITTETYPHSTSFGRHWKLTPTGAAELWRLALTYRDYLAEHEPPEDCLPDVHQQPCPDSTN